MQLFCFNISSDSYRRCQPYTKCLLWTDSTECLFEFIHIGNAEIQISQLIRAFRGPDTNGRFSTISAKEDNFCDLLFAFLHTKPPSESKFFPLRVNPFSVERKMDFNRVVSLESVTVLLN